MPRNNKSTTNQARDTKLVEEIKKTHCNTSLKELYENHSALVVSIATRLSKKYSNWNITQEVIDDAIYIVYRAAIKFDSNRKTKFSTFLGNETKWAFLNKCNKIKNQNRNVNQMGTLIDCLDLSYEKTAPNSDTIKSMFEILAVHPDPRIFKIFKLRYQVGKKNNVMPWHLIANRLKLSAQGCINIHNIGVSFIREKLSKEGNLC